MRLGSTASALARPERVDVEEAGRYRRQFTGLPRVGRERLVLVVHIALGRVVRVRQLTLLRGRTGGGGAPFNLGEATVSRASVRIDSGEVGHGYCLGRDGEKARLIAVLDALFQREPERVERDVLAPLRALAETSDGKRRAETAATRVDFFTMVRGED